MEKTTMEKIKEKLKKTEILKRLKIRFQLNYKDIVLNHIPWLDKPLSVQNDFIELCLIKQDITGKQKLEQKISINDLANLNFEKTDSCSSKVIYIEGKAGCGKSVLASKLAQKWALGDKNFLVYDLVFLIALRRHNKESIKSMLTQQFMEGLDGTVEEIQHVIETSNILFILDGYDEITSANQKKATEFIKEILRHPKFTVVLTSRSSFFHQELKINFVKIKHKGFSEYGKIEFLNNYFEKENSEQIARIIQLMKSNINISDLCQCPLLLLLFSFLIKSNSEDNEIPQTLTSLFKQFVNLIIQRHFNKTGEKKIEKVDVFDIALSDKNLKALNESIYKFGKLALELQKENKTVYAVKRINEECADIFLKVGFLIKTKVDDKFVEPFHRSFVELFCGYYLSKVFTKDKYKFKKCLRQVLYSNEKEYSLTIPFISGFLEKRVKNMIGMIPRWFYFGNVQNLIILLQESHTFLEDKKRLKLLSPTVLGLDVSVQKEVFVMNSSCNRNLSQDFSKLNLPFYEKKQWLGCEIEVIHGLPEYQSPYRFCNIFKKDSFGAILLNFPCQNNKDKRKCIEKNFTEQQLTTLIQQIIEKKPFSLGICFPHSKHSFCVMLQCLSRSTLQLMGLSLLTNSFINEDIKKVATVVMNQGLNELTLISNEVSAKESVISNEKSTSVLQINPLLEAIMDEDCQLKTLKLFDINMTKEEFDLLIYSASTSSTIEELTINYSSASENIIDIAQLCLMGQRTWDSLDLKNIRISSSQECILQVNTLSLIKCVFEDDPVALFPWYEVKRLVCDCQLLNSVCQTSNSNFPFYDLLQCVIIEDTIFSLSTLFVFQLKNLSCLSLDLRGGFECDKDSEDKLICFLIQTKFLYCFSLYFAFDSDAYLDQIDFFVNCFKVSSEILELKLKNKIQVLHLYFGPQDRGCNILNAAVLQREDSQTLLQHISKFKPFLTNGFSKKLVMEIRQSNQKGHVLGPFLKIDEYFPEEDFRVDSKFYGGTCEAKWTIQSWKTKSVNIDLQIFLIALHSCLEDDTRSPETENIDLQIFLTVLKSFLEHKIRAADASEINTQELLDDLKTFLELKIRATEAVWEKILHVVQSFLEKKIREKKQKETIKRKKSCVIQ